MIIIENWVIVKKKEKYIIRGIVYHHPSIRDEKMIDTSPILDTRVEDEDVVFITKSGTEYHCFYKDHRHDDYFTNNDIEQYASDIFGKQTADFIKKRIISESL